MRLRIGLLPRAALSLALVGLLPVGFAATRLIDLNRDEMRKQVQTTHALAARSAAARVDSFLKRWLALASGLAGHPSLADTRSVEAQGLLSESLQAWSPAGALGIAITNRAGEEVIRVQLTDAAQRQRVDAALALETSEPVVVERAGAFLVLRFDAELRGQNGRLALVTDGAGLTETLETSELLREAELVLATRDGQVLAGYPESLEGFSPEVVQAALSGKLTGAKPPAGDGKNNDFIAAWSFVTEVPWVVLSRQPAAVAFEVARQMRRQATLVTAATLVLIGLVSGAAYWTLVRPIRQLTRAQQRLAGLPEQGAGNEIDQLKASFEALEKRLAERQALDEVFLGRYQVRSVVGSGAMGTVFRGWDPKLQRPVALKTIRLDRKLSGQARSDLVSRLLNEAVTVARFNHPNIVAVFDVEDRAEGAFVAMELVDGVSLEMLLWQSGRLPAARVIPLGAGIARALSTAHQAGIVHRDVKPPNVLLGFDGSIKVTDFGISELISSMTDRGDVVFGTPGFVPPETLQGRGFDQAGDLFSMGAVLYLALTGRQVFEGKTVKEVIRRTLFGVITPPSQLAPDVPAELDALVLELLARDPAERPGSAGEVADRLERLSAEGDAHWEPPEPAEETLTAPGAGRPTQWIETTRLAERPAPTRQLPT